MPATVRVLAGAACALAMVTASAVHGAPAGDPKAGEAIYARCAACHALEYDRTGPRHCGLFGRRAGSVPGFDYSQAMKQSRIVWNEATLDRFLAGALLPAAWYAKAQRFRSWFRDQVRALFETVDIVLAPATPCAGRSPPGRGTR